MIRPGSDSSRFGTLSGKGLFLLLWLLTVGMVLAAPARAEVPPVEAFGRSPALDGVDLSPDGTRALSIATVEGKPLVAVMDPDAADARWRAVMRGDSSQFQVSWCRFKTRDRILCGFRGTDFIAGVPVLFSRLIALDADGRNVVQLMKTTQNSGGQFQDRVVDMLWDDPRHILVELAEELGDRRSVVRVDVHSGSTRSHSAPRGTILRFYSDGRGAVRLARGLNGKRVIWYGRAGNDAPWVPLERYRVFEEDNVDFLGFDDSGMRFFVRRPHEGRDALWLHDLVDRENAQLVFSHPSVDVGEAVLWGERVVGIAYDAERPEVHWLDEGVRAVYAKLRRMLPGAIPTVVGRSRDGTRLLVRMEADRQPPVILLVDLQAARARVIAESYPGLPSASLGAMRSIVFPARDGVMIPGYVTTRDTAPATRLPMIVMPHDGPLERDRWGFDYLQQFLVSRGYAVLQIDFRGSSGYGQAWTKAAHQDWGGRTYEDVVDGVQWAIDKGIAHPDRIAILGRGFGGYLALLGAKRDPERFRCAVGIGAVTDLRRTLGFRAHFVGGDILREQMGADAGELRDDSPARGVDGLRVPVLLIHGASDYWVPVTQGRMMRDALVRHAKPHAYVEYEGDTSTLERGENRIDMLRRIEAFLATQLIPPAAIVAGTAGGTH